MHHPATLRAAANDSSHQALQSQRWEHIRVEQFQKPPAEGWGSFGAEHTLFMSLVSRPFYCTIQDEEGTSFSGLFRRGDLTLAPPNRQFFSRWEDEDCYVQIQLPTQFLQRVALETLNRDFDRLELLAIAQTRNSQTEAIATMLLTERQQEQSSGALYVDSLANVLAVHLLRNYATTQPLLPSFEGGLPPRQLGRIVDYIDSYLERDIKLADLAELLSMSPFHFSRLFKQSTGLSPHQYLLQQRVERAKQLLRNTDRLIADIALECGFSSHSHLSRKFRQFTGMTPKAYRTR